MTKIIPVPTQEEQAFCALLTKLNLDRSHFKLELTEHSPATYGPRVKTIKIFCKDKLTAEYGAATATSWVEQFRADWDSGLIPEVLDDHRKVWASQDSLMSRDEVACQAEKGSYAERALGILANYPNAGAEPRVCSDQYVGLIELLGTSPDFSVRLPASERDLRQPCVLLILESPHTQEFIPPDEEPKPANGQTGKNIQGYFSSVEGLQGFKKCGLILINAVQYQCSRGKKPLPRAETDNVFRELWLVGGKQDLISRIKRLVGKDDIVVNACVSGKSNSSKTCLRSLVQHAVDEADLGLPVLHSFHPSQWHVDSRRKRRKSPY